jgi:protein involved in temperature-dependent protein secretion
LESVAAENRKDKIVTFDDIVALVHGGEFVAALAGLRQENLALEQPEVSALLLQFDLEVQLQQVVEAQTTATRLALVHPAWQQAAAGLQKTARADATAALRLSDAKLAGNRNNIGMPPPHAVEYMQAAVMHAQQRHDEAAELLTSAASQAPRTAGTVSRRNGHSFSFTHVVDSDDLTGAIFPVFNGEDVLDIAFCQIRSIAALPRRSSFDSTWMPVEIRLIDGQSFQCRHPAKYAGSALAHEPAVRTGRTTMWNRSLGYAIAIGQRDLQFTKLDGGTALIGILQIARIDFAPIQ